MFNYSSLNKPINSYIVNIQILLIFIVVSITTKFHLDNYSFHGLFILLFTLIVTLIFLILKYKNHKSHGLQFIFILIDIALITSIMLITNASHLEVLFLIPILIVAIEFPPGVSVFFPLFLALYNGVIKYFTSSANPYIIEQDIIILGLFIMVSWLVGSVFKVEKETREELQRTRVDLKENKALVEDIIHFMPLGRLVVDTEEKIVHINQRALDINNITDKKASDYVGGSFIDYYSDREEVLAVHKSLIMKLLYKEQSFYKIKIINSGKVLEYSGKAFYDETKKLTYAILVFRDISQEERNREKINQLERINLISQMASSIAQEIKKPLTTIKGYLNLAFKDKEHLNQVNLDLLVKEIDRCNTIISDFLSVARKVDNKKEVSNLVEIISELSVLIGQDALFNGINYRQEIEEVPDLVLNKNEIKQLLLNLCRNGIEAMDGEGTLTLRVRPIKDAVVVEVEDTGIGIKEEDLEKISIPFFTTKGSGTGLGLSVCSRIIKNHGGKSTITSKPGLGTKVTICFPNIESKIQAQG